MMAELAVRENEDEVGLGLEIASTLITLPWRADGGLEKPLNGSSSNVSGSGLTCGGGCELDIGIFCATG